MDVKDKIRNFIIKELEEIGGNIPKLEIETHLIEEGILDSLMILSLIAFLDEEFKITLNEEEINPESFATIQEIANLVTKKSASVSKF
jgi:methoxymalonate biosynthesis acyl carrier protein